MLEVDDTGPGIPLQSWQKIFGDFQRLPETSTGQPGAGLGLAIVRRLVQLLKGRIELESEAGSGTSFPGDPANALRVRQVLRFETRIPRRLILIRSMRRPENGNLRYPREARGSFDI
jgi:signal transduction histidine kinase